LWSIVYFIFTFIPLRSKNETDKENPQKETRRYQLKELQDGVGEENVGGVLLERDGTDGVDVFHERRDRVQCGKLFIVLRVSLEHRQTAGRRTNSDTSTSYSLYLHFNGHLPGGSW